MQERPHLERHNEATQQCPAQSDRACDRFRNTEAEKHETSLVVQRASDETGEESERKLGLTARFARAMKSARKLSDGPQLLLMKHFYIF